MRSGKQTNMHMYMMSSLMWVYDDKFVTGSKDLFRDCECWCSQPLDPTRLFVLHPFTFDTSAFLSCDCASIEPVECVSLLSKSISVVDLFSHLLMLIVIFEICTILTKPNHNERQS